MTNKKSPSTDANQRLNQTLNQSEKNKELITSFYQAFQELNATKMATCYHKDIAFSDPVFTNLKGSEAKAMWKMLCEQAKNFKLTFKDVEATETTGSAYWIAEYNFSLTGKQVTNKIKANFIFKDGKIIEHKDSFDYKLWIKMSFGLLGILFNPFLQKMIKKGANKNLKKYILKNKIN